MGRPERSATSSRLWVLNQSDGDRSLLEVAERSGVPLALLAEVAADLEAAGLLAEAP